MGLRLEKRLNPQRKSREVKLGKEVIAMRQRMGIRSEPPGLRIITVQVKENTGRKHSQL